MAVGFLYDGNDHKVNLINPERGIDLFLRIEACPEDTRNFQPTSAVLKGKRAALQKTAASVLLKGEPGNGNPHSVLIVRECLADVIDGTHTAAEQLEKILKQFEKWLRVLFHDGKLEEAFRKSGLDSGME